MVMAKKRATKKAPAKKRTRRAARKGPTSVVVMSNPSHPKKARRRRRRARAHANPSHHYGHAKPRRRSRRRHRNPSMLFNVVSGLAGAAAGYVASMAADMSSMDPKTLAYVKVGVGLVGGVAVGYAAKLPAAGAGWAVGLAAPGAVALYKGAGAGAKPAVSDAMRKLGAAGGLGAVYQGAQELQLGAVYQGAGLGEVYQGAGLGEPSAFVYDEAMLDEDQGDSGDYPIDGTNAYSGDY
jgi:hypothetical protein